MKKPKITKPTRSDLLRDHINKKLESNFDYSTLSNKKLDIDEFAKNNNVKDEKIIRNLGQLHNKILKQCMKRKGIDPRSIGLEKQIPKMRSATGGLSPEITPKPQASTIQTTSEQQIQTSTTGQPLEMQGTQIIQPVLQTYDNESVRAVFHALYLGARSVVNPIAEDLSESELKSLGTLWVRLFNKYLNEKMEIIIAVTATAGIFAPKLMKGRKKKEVEKEKIETKPEESDKKGNSKPKETNEKPTAKTVKELTTQDAIDKEESDKIKNLDEGEKWDA